MDTISRTAKLLNSAERIAVLTGAGVSQESNVPTFRDALTGLWAQYDPQQLATKEAFRAQPSLVWNWYEFRRGLVRAAQPNAGHIALAQLAQKRPQVSIITQNVDDLHEQAGSPNVYHLHGLISQSKCFFDCQGSPTLVDVSSSPSPDETPPPCLYCGRWLRPNVVWFGENLPQEVFYSATQQIMEAHVVLVVGTSGLVDPAGSLPLIGKQHGAHIIEVNPTESAITPIADIYLREKSGVALPLILEAMAQV
jgi:NAD-dependent deacetylase